MWIFLASKMYYISVFFTNFAVDRAAALQSRARARRKVTKKEKF